MPDDKRLQELKKLTINLGLSIDDYDYLDLALTHSSYTFENKLDSLLNNERLEFLGDAVLKLIASRYLYDRFPEYSEGDLTKIRSILVSDSILAKLARNLNLGKYLKLGFHEKKMGGAERSSNLACAFEAVLGAFYIDGKINQLHNFLVVLFEPEVSIIDQSVAKSNFKAILQEYTQGEYMCLPEYRVVKEEGPPHNKTFEIEVFVNDKSVGHGVGKSKKEAQQKAAEMALNSLKLLD